LERYDGLHHSIDRASYNCFHNVSEIVFTISSVDWDEEIEKFCVHGDGRKNFIDVTSPIGRLDKRIYA
jgi:hypothetical protein